MAKPAKCNKCGREFDIFDKKAGFSLHKKIGYGSRYDGDTLELDMCCDCMDGLIESCAISPIRSPSEPDYIQLHIRYDGEGDE